MNGSRLNSFVLPIFVFAASFATGFVSANAAEPKRPAFLSGGPVPTPTPDPSPTPSGDISATIATENDAVLTDDDQIEFAVDWNNANSPPDVSTGPLSFPVRRNTTFSVSLASYLYDPEFNPFTATPASPYTRRGGLVSISDPPVYMLRYVPPADFIGTDEILVVLVDSPGRASNIVRVLFLVAP